MKTIYTVKSINSGAVMVKGTATECAKFLHVTKSRFYTMVQNSKFGLHKNYKITMESEAFNG